MSKRAWSAATLLIGAAVLTAPLPTRASLVACTGNVCDPILFPANNQPAYMSLISNAPGNFNSVVSYLDTAQPGVINYIQTNASDPGGYPYPGSSKAANGSLVDGTIKLKNQVGAQNYYFSSDNIQLQAKDTFTLHGLPGTVEITARFIATGSVALAAVNNFPDLQGADIDLTLCGPGGSFACGGDKFKLPVNGSNPNFPGYSGPIYSSNVGPSQEYLERDWTFQQAVDAPFTLSYALSSTVYNGSLADISHTASLSFILPDGYTITSVGGYAPREAGVGVPEPASLALLAAGAVGLIVTRRRVT